MSRERKDKHTDHSDSIQLPVPASNPNILKHTSIDGHTNAFRHTSKHTVTHHLICAQQVLYKREWESSITLPPLTISQGVLKSNVFSNAGFWLVAWPGWLWYMIRETSERASRAISSRNWTQPRPRLFLLYVIGMFYTWVIQQKETRKIERDE